MGRSLTARREGFIECADDLIALCRRPKVAAHPMRDLDFIQGEGCDTDIPV